MPNSVNIFFKSSKAYVSAKSPPTILTESSKVNSLFPTVISLGVGYILISLVISLFLISFFNPSSAFTDTLIPRFKAITDAKHIVNFFLKSLLIIKIPQYFI